MKKMLFVAAAALCAFTACRQDAADIHPSDNPDERTAELVVPAGFDWSTTRAVACDFTAPHLSRVALSETPDGEPVALFFAGGDCSPVTLNLPATADRLYVRYQTEEGFSAAESVAVGADRMTYAVSPLAKDYEGIADGDQAETVGGVIYYPVRANGWGTLMFEDLWPAYGDYDFNDLVLNYKIQLYMNNKNMVDAMLIGIRVKAVGGSIPYDIYLRMTGVRGGQIDEVEPYFSQNAPETADMVQLNPGNSVKEPAVFLFRDTKTRNNNPVGAVYVNTERGYEVPESQLAQVSYQVYFRNSIKLEDVTFDTFDFFLGRADEASDGLKEIHRGGFAPTEYGRAAYERLREGNTNIDGADYYYSNDGLVWGINIPAEVQHAYENVDFLKAYPGFARWARSGGATDTDWYLHGVSENLVDKR